MKEFGEEALRGVVRMDDPEVMAEIACQNERANWIASRVGLPTIGGKMVNKYGIEWVVQNHATVPTANSLQSWRSGEIQPESDLYPVVAPMNLSPKLMKFIHAVDRCTTKTFAILDTMPGRREGVHLPGANSIDTTVHPVTNFLFLDAARVNESVIAHELGHAWIQYVDECEDRRTMEDASDPQRMWQVCYVQSFVLDLKVNDLIRSKGFDMQPIENDQAASLSQLAAALQKGFQPKHPREQIFLSLLVADQMLQRDAGRSNEIAHFDTSLEQIRQKLAPVANLAERMAESVRKHGYDSHASITACIDECLLASFELCGEHFDLDNELVLVNREEPDLDKFPNWIPVLPPKLKCRVGRHMAKNDIPLEWAHSTGPTLTERTRVTFCSPEGVRSEVIVPHRIGPATPYGGMSEDMAELLEIKRQNEERRKKQIPKGMPDPANPKEVNEFNERNRQRMFGQNPSPFPPNWPNQPGRPYMAGLGSFLTAARLAEQIGGEHPYAYALSNPTTYVDPSGLSPETDQTVVAVLGGIALADDWNPLGWCLTAGLGCYVVYELCQAPPSHPLSIPWPGPAPVPAPIRRPSRSPDPIWTPPNNKSWHCLAQCGVIGPTPPCGFYSYGTASGRTQTDACKAAKKAANDSVQQLKPTCEVHHCKCSCTRS